MSRVIPGSRTSVTWGNRWSVSAEEKDGERGERFPTVRHEHLLGLIGRSHFPAQAQAEEREDRRQLVDEFGYTAAILFHIIAYQTPHPFGRPTQPDTLGSN